MLQFHKQLVVEIWWINDYSVGEIFRVKIEMPYAFVMVTTFFFFFTLTCGFIKDLIEAQAQLRPARSRSLEGSDLLTIVWA